LRPQNDTIIQPQSIMNDSNLDSKISELEERLNNKIQKTLPEGSLRQL